MISISLDDDAIIPIVSVDSEDFFQNLINGLDSTTVTKILLKLVLISKLMLARFSAWISIACMMVWDLIKL